MNRFIFLDFIRGLAIVLMIVDHGYDWWLDEMGHALPIASVSKFLGTLAAPIFLFVAGLSLSLVAWRSSQTQTKPKQLARKLLQRGAMLILYGYLLNFLVFFTGSNPEELLAVDVLHTIGLGIIVCIPFLWVNSWTTIILTIGWVVLSHQAGSWSLPEQVAAWLTGTDGISYFPFLLWFPYMALGLGIGQMLWRVKNPGRVILVLVVAGLLSFLSAAFVNPDWGYRHPKPMFELFSLTVIFWLLSASWYWTERLGKKGRMLSVLAEMGRASLFIYAVHQLIGYRLVWLLGWVNGHSWLGQFGIFHPRQASLVLLGLLLLMWALSYLWNHRHSQNRFWSHLGSR